MYRDGNPRDDPTVFDELAAWGIDAMVRFHDALGPMVKALPKGLQTVEAT